MAYTVVGLARRIPSCYRWVDVLALQVKKDRVFMSNQPRAWSCIARFIFSVVCLYVCIAPLVSAERFQLEVLTSGSEASPVARYSSAVQSFPSLNEVIVFGGRSKTSTLNDTWIYNTAAKTWLQIPATGPSPRYQTLSTVIDFGGVENEGKYLYVLGGRSRNSALEVRDSIWAYKLSTKTWNVVYFNSFSPTTGKELRIFPRAAAAGGSTGGNDIILSHGEGRDSHKYSDTYLISFLSPTRAFVKEKLYGDVETFQGVGDLRALSEGASVVTPANELVVFGGCYRTGLCPSQDAWAFDIDQRQWRLLKRGPSSRRLASAARALPSMSNNRQTMILWGGLEESKQTLRVQFSSPLEIDVLDVRARKWKRELASVRGPTAIEKRYGSSIVVVGDGKANNPYRYLIFGGVSTDGLENPSDKLFSLTFNPNEKSVLASKGVARASGYLFLHGIFMFSAFALCLPVGFGVARYLRQAATSKWFMLHSSTQIVGGILSWIGIAFAIVGANDYPTHIHGLCGIAVQTLVTLQLLFATPCFRPNANAGSKRRIWTSGHQVIGWAVVFLGLFTSCVGMILLQVPVEAWLTFLVFIIAYVAGVVVLEIRRASRRDHKTDKYVREDDEQVTDSSSILDAIETTVGASPELLSDLEST